MPCGATGCSWAGCVWGVVLDVSPAPLHGAHSSKTITNIITISASAATNAAGELIGSLCESYEGRYALCWCPSSMRVTSYWHGIPGGVPMLPQSSDQGWQNRLNQIGTRCSRHVVADISDSLKPRV